MPIKSYTRLEIPEVILIEEKQFPDERGYFEELWAKEELKGLIGEYGFVQANHSFSKPGVIRGLHYQLKPFAQGKLVTVIHGKIFDVAVDIRKGSPTFGKWVSVELTPGKLLWIPPYFAHGFQALEESHVIYFVTAPYSPKHDRGIRYDDPEIGVKWPLKEAIVSEKDKKHPFLRDAEINFVYGEV